MKWLGENGTVCASSKLVKRFLLNRRSTRWPAVGEGANGAAGVMSKANLEDKLFAA